MAVALVQEFRIQDGDRSTTNYDAINERLKNEMPDGAVIHTAGFDGDVFRIFEVWESREQAEEFADRVRAVRQEIGVGSDRPAMEYFEVHNLMQ